MVPKAVRKHVRLAEQQTAAEITAPMPRQKTCRLGSASLDTGQRRLGVVERQANHLQPVVALVELHDLALADHAVVVGHDPELDLNTHARPKGCFYWSASLSIADTLDQIPTPTVCHAPQRRRSRRNLHSGRDSVGG
jgi:hypothetical protein